jgi:hypothetical protein
VAVIAEEMGGDPVQDAPFIRIRFGNTTSNAGNAVAGDDQEGISQIVDIATLYHGLIS